jgi:predicted small metal-binding protein
MERHYIDCRDYPYPVVKCSVAIAADTKEELLEAAVQHGGKVHGYKETYRIFFFISSLLPSSCILRFIVAVSGK